MKKHFALIPFLELGIKLGMIPWHFEMKIWNDGNLLAEKSFKSFYVQKQVLRKFYETVDVISFHWVSTKQTIVYKNTDKWYIEWQRVTTSDTTSDNKWQRVTTNDNEWYNEWQRMVQRETASDKKWQRMKTSDNKWLRVTTSGHFG